MNQFSVELRTQWAEPRGAESHVQESVDVRLNQGSSNMHLNRFQNS